MLLTSEWVDTRFSECGNHQENMGLSEKQAKPQIWGLASLSTLKQPLIFRSWWCLPPHFQVTDLLHERDILGKVGHDLLEAKGRMTIRHSHIGHNRCISVWGHFVYEPYLRFLYMEGDIYIYIICVYIYTHCKFGKTSVRWWIMRSWYFQRCLWLFSHEAWANTSSKEQLHRATRCVCDDQEPTN